MCWWGRRLSLGTRRKVERKGKMIASRKIKKHLWGDSTHKIRSKIAWILLTILSSLTEVAESLNFKVFIYWIRMQAVSTSGCGCYTYLMQPGLCRKGKTIAASVYTSTGGTQPLHLPRWAGSRQIWNPETLKSRSVFWKTAFLLPSKKQTYELTEGRYAMPGKLSSSAFSCWL